MCSRFKKSCFLKLSYIDFFIFSFFSNKFYKKKCRRQQDWNSFLGVEGEHADHLTTTTARLEKKFLLCKIVQQLKLKNPFGHLQRRRRKRRQRRRRRSETISRQKIPHPIKISPAETGLSAGNGSACEFQL